MIHADFWRNKKVFLTGHTGFKGSWLSIWLHSLGADITGYSLDPPSQPSLYEIADIQSIVKSIHGDIRDIDFLKSSMKKVNPDIVIHMAAQSLVRESYTDPVGTYSTNAMGTIHVFEAIKECDSVQSVLNITTDKCYENNEWDWGYREIDPLGGYDPYSSSKACAEIITSAYRRSFMMEKGVGLASARAGNVIGGGDWADNRLIPDCLRAFLNNEKVEIRYPKSIRPWQFVLEPLNGYLILVEKLTENPDLFAQAWNFGPDDSDAKPVKWIVEKMCSKWGEGSDYILNEGNHFHEAGYLKLDCSKAKNQLNWQPKYNLEYAMNSIIEWTKEYQSKSNMLQVCLNQIEDFQRGS